MIRKLVLILSSFVLIRFYLIFFISGLFYGFPELGFQGILILSRDPRYTLDIELASCILPLVLSWIVRNQPTSAVLQESSDRTNCKILFHSSTKPKDLGNEMVMEYLFFSENVVLLMRSFARDPLSFTRLLRMFLPSTDMILCKPQFRRFVPFFNYILRIFVAEGWNISGIS